MKMATPPTTQQATSANLNAWKKVTGVTNEGVAIVEKPKSPSITGVVRQREDSPVPEIGSDSYSAANARKRATEITEYYTLEELTTLVDSTIAHIRDRADNGEVEAGLDTNSCNAGLRRALLRELRHRGFKVTRSGADYANSYDISWEPLNWKKLGKSLIGPLLLVLVIAGLVTIGRLAMTRINEHHPAAIEQPLERGK
jgi:hypothetical protein